MKTKLTKTKIGGLLCLLAASTSLNAATVILVIDDELESSRIRDWSVDGNGDLSQTEQGNLVGTLSWGPAVHTTFAIQMLGTDPILNADFSAAVSSVSAGLPYNVDLCVSRVDASGTILASDFQASTLIMEDFVTATDAVGTYSLDATGQANLTSYLQANWAENEYVFLTLKTDPAISANGTASQGYGFGGSSTTAPQITLTTVPEPSSTALLGLAGLGFLARRKRS